MAITNTQSRGSRMIQMSRLAAMSALLTLAGGVALMPRLSGQTRPVAAGSRIGEWTHYAADAREAPGMSPLDQINARTSTSSRWRGGSRPTTSDRVPSSSLRARR